MLKFRRYILFVLLILISLSTAGCTAQTEAQKKLGIDSEYFAGLRMLSEGNEKIAREKFNLCIKKGSYYCAKKSLEALCTFGNIQEKNQAAEKLIKTYKEEDSLLIAAKQFKSSNEINKLIEATSSLDFSTAKNELIRLRLEAMGTRGDSTYEAEVYRWFTECPVSSEHYQFYRDFYNHPDFSGAYENPDEAIELKYTPEQFVINYRIESYKRNYTYTLKYTEELLNYFRDGKIKPVPQIVSDTGKNLLYGSQNYQKNGTVFHQLASDFSGTPAEFYFWFYAARLFDKTGMFPSLVMVCFEGAVKCANTSAEKDNALWYLLKLYTTVPSRNGTIDSIIFSIKKYADQWTDPEYFEDYFEGLIPSLLASGRWETFGEIYHIIDGYASDLTAAQYAYIYARLIQEGLVKGSEEEAENALRRACRSGTSFYYKILAANQLGIKSDSEEFEKIMTASAKPKEVTVNPAAEKLLLGYTYFGFPDLVYPEWQKHSEEISVSTALYLSDFLAKCAASGGDENYYPQALRIASRVQLYSERNFTSEELKYVFPQFYSAFISKYSAQYSLPESVMYALVRSESFFDADVISSAGAVGLAQLMELTAGDIARRFKMNDYSLTDPETNIRFGAYYIENQISRSDNSLIMGFFSYNAGIKKVRRWLQSSQIEFDKKSNMPVDLFLESIPYAETREYGRKLVSATAAYEWLYNPENYQVIIQDLLK